MRSDLLLFGTTFLASAVEAVEALTIVLAVGVVRGWRSTLFGVGAATIVLAGVVAVLGPALRLIPIGTLRFVVGALLLAFGLQWLRKAILRTSGYKPLHDEASAFQREREQAGAVASGSARIDWYSFTVAFKGVLLEGLEVVFIVVTFGATQGRLGLAATAAASAVVLVVVVGCLVRGPLERVPENTIKYRSRPAADELRHLLGRRGSRRRLARLRPRDPRHRRLPRPRLRPAHAPAPPAAARRPASGGRGVRYLRSFGAFWWNFIVGDDWRVAAGLAVALGLTALLAHNGINAWWLLPAAVAVLLWSAVRRETSGHD